MTGLLRSLAVLAWPATVGISLGAHGVAGYWLMQGDAVQTEGDLPEMPSIEVAFIPAPAPLPTPAEPPAMAPPVPDATPKLPEARPPEPVVEQPEPQPLQPKPAPLAKPVPKPKPAPAEPSAEPRKPTPAPKKDTRKQPDKAAPAEKAAPQQPVQKPAEAAQAAAKSKPAKAGSAEGNRKWASKIRSRIERKKRYPAAANGATGSVTVHIRIAASGALSGVSVTGSSGNAALDAAALKAVKSAAPFPAAPAGQGGAEFSLTMVFSST